MNDIERQAAIDVITALLNKNKPQQPPQGPQEPPQGPQGPQEPPQGPQEPPEGPEGPEKPDAPQGPKGGKDSGLSPEYIAAWTEIMNRFDNDNVSDQEIKDMISKIRAGRISEI